jgi:hypothetical protein
MALAGSATFMDHIDHIDHIPDEGREARRACGDEHAPDLSRPERHP